MNNAKAIQENRLNKLRKLIQKEFASGKYVISLEPEISISSSAPTKGSTRVPRVTFSYTEEIMTDMDSQIDEVFLHGIQIAKDILKNPPLVDRILQGDVLLDHGGAVFNKRLVP
jgi:hypothetical protein